jgi:hypothetical protein
MNQLRFSARMSRQLTTLVVLTTASTVLLLWSSGIVGGQGPSSPLPNQLTPAEKAEGWRLLFNGETLEGWRGFHREDIPGGWMVEAGTLRKTPGRGTPENPGGDLISIDQFENFELALEWKISRAGNSGIKYLVSESLPPTGRGAISFEYQVLDDDHHPDAKMGIAGNRTTGALYDLIAPSADKVLRPVGAFNETRIIVRGNLIEHWLNGRRVVSFDRSSAEYRSKVAASKFKTTRGFGEAVRGHVLLQDHQDEVWYRSIRIRELQ